MRTLCRLRLYALLGSYHPSLVTIACPVRRTSDQGSGLATIAEIEQPIVIENDEDTKMTGGSAGSGSRRPKGCCGSTCPEASCTEGPIIVETKGSTQECSFNGEQGSTSCGQVCCSKGTNCGTSDFPMTLPGLPSSIGYYLGTCDSDLKGPSG